MYNFRVRRTTIALIIIIMSMVPLSIGFSFFRLYVWNIGFGIALLLDLGSVCQRNVNSIGRPRVWTIVLLIHAATAPFSTIVSRNPNVNLAASTQYASIVILAIWMRNVASKSEDFLGSLGAIAVLLVVLQSSLSVIQQLTFSEFGNLTAYFGSPETPTLSVVGSTVLTRARGTLGQPNVVAMWILTLTPFGVIFLSTKWRETRFSFYIVVAFVCLSLLGLALTLSRGMIGLALGALGLLVVAEFFWRPLLFWRIRKRALLLFAVIVTGLTAIVLLLRNSPIIMIGLALAHRIAEGTRSMGGDAIWIRTEMIAGGIEIASLYPALGIGFGASSKIWSDVSTKLPRYLNVRIHNLPILFLAETGILGMTFYLIAIAVPLVRLLGTYPRDRWWYASMATVLIIIFTSQLYVAPVTADYGPLAWAMLGSIMGMIDNSIRKRTAILQM